MSNIEPTPFGEKYVLVEHIATGGMAEIYRATYSGIEGFAKELVIKRLREEFAERANVVRMFLDEARVAATLTHQNVVHTYDLGEIGGEYFIAMEFLKGQELVAVLRKAAKTGNMVPLQISLGIIMQALEGLYYVHARTDEHGRNLGLCHRDINPTNIHVGYDGTCKIVDFGIAATRASLHNTGEGQFAGKLAYMAPEQVLGHPIDARADIFALGIVLYEMCLGRRLFRGLPEEVAERIVEGDIPAPTFVNPEFPPALEAIIMKALEVDTAERYQNCDHMFRDLERFTEEAGIRCTPRMISAYMAEMWGEGAPAEVNYDDLYDDLVDEALDFDKFDRLDQQEGSDDAPDWAKTAGASTTKKRSMTIGNLDALVAEVQKMQEAQQEPAKPRSKTAPQPEPSAPTQATGNRRPTGQRKQSSGQFKTVPKAEPESATGSGPRRTGAGTGPHRSLTAGRAQAGRPGATLTTGVMPVVDSGATSSFGHGVMADQTKRSSGAITWILVLFGLGGIGWIAYTMFTMK